MSGTNPLKRRRADTAGHDDRALSTRLDAQNLAHRATPQSLHTRVELWRTAAQDLGAERPSTPGIPQTPVRPSTQAPAKLPSQMYVPEHWFSVNDENGKIMRGKHGERLKKWLRSKPPSWHRSFEEALDDKAKGELERYQKALKVQSIRESAQRYEDWAALKREEALALSLELGEDEEEDYLKVTAVVNRLFAGCIDESVHPPGRTDWLGERLEYLNYPIARSSPEIVEVPTRGKGRASSARTRQSAPAATPTGKVSERWSHHAHEINDRTQTRCACKGSNANMQYRGSGDPCKLPCAGCSRFGAGCTAECMCGGTGTGLCANKFNNTDGSRYGYLRHFFGADAEGRFPNMRTGVPEPIFPTGCFVTWLWKETKTACLATLPVVEFAEELARHFTLRDKDSTFDKKALRQMDGWLKQFNLVGHTAKAPNASQEEKVRAEADRKTLAQELFRIAGAEGADGTKHSWYNFSFCRNKWLDGSDTEMRHCWLCRRCVDGSMWHCGKCNTCRPAPRTPCFKCGGISRELAEASASEGVS